MANDNKDYKKQKEPTHTFESVWKSLQEVSAMQKDLTQKQADLTEKQADLTQKQTDLTDKQANTTRNVNMLDDGFEKTRRLVDQLTQNVNQVTQDMREANRETRRNIDQVTQNIDRDSKETRRNIDKMSRETTKNINKLRGDWDNQWGEFIEVLVSDNLERLFEDHGIIKGEIETVNNRVYRSVSGLTLFEFDSITMNGDKIIITETKKRMTIDKIDNFVGRVKKFLAIKDNEFANKKVYIAIGYLKADNEKHLIEYAENLGLFVIKAAGDNAVLINSLQTTTI